MSELDLDVLMGNQKQEKDPKEKMLDSAFSKKNLRMKTDLSKRQISAFVKLEMFGEIYGNKTIKKIHNKFYELLISKDRKGRKEFSDMARNVLSDMEYGGMRGISGSLLGRE